MADLLLDVLVAGVLTVFWLVAVAGAACLLVEGCWRLNAWLHRGEL